MFDEGGERLDPSELKSGITREQVVNAYKKFVERGITNPDDLDLEDPEVKEANGLFDKWREQEDTLAARDEESKHRVNLSKSMLYVDAGFTDPAYLKEILGGWLVQDAENAKKQSDNPERVETHRQIAEAMRKIREILAGQS